MVAFINGYLLSGATMTEHEPRPAESTSPHTDSSKRHTDAGDDSDDRPRMRDVDQTGPGELDANGVWSRGPATPPGADADETTPADD